MEGNLTQNQRIKVALLSCSDKTGLDELGRFLIGQGVQLLASGGTAAFLEKNKLAVTKVEDWTGTAEILGGRVKTLHPRIHAALLYRRDQQTDLECLKDMELDGIDLVVVNLYPFEQQAQVENIDIGGPTIIRAAAKNFQWVTVLSHPNQYQKFQNEMNDHQGQTSLIYRKQCAADVFSKMAAYDGLIGNYLAETQKQFQVNFALQEELRYGENPQQKAALYMPENSLPFELLQGKQLSYNNYCDIQTVVQMMAEFPAFFEDRKDEAACVIVKHQNPIGFAISTHAMDAWEKALVGDSQAAFGGIVACNFEPTEEVVQAWQEMFLEVIIAPKWSPQAIEVLQSKKNLRLLKWPQFHKNYPQVRSWFNGYLVQSPDAFENATAWEVKTKKEPSAEQKTAARLAWFVSRFVKSNAIVVADKDHVVAVGAGQMSRVDAIEIVKHKIDRLGSAFDRSLCAVASDAFFPFADSIEILADLKMQCVVQPMGSVRDNEVVAACDKNNLAMIATSCRHFYH